MGALLSACGSPNNDISTLTGRRAAIVATNKALTNNDCTGAIAIIEPLYNSVYSDNEIRLIYASAHGCNAGINFFTLVGDLVNSPPVGPMLWTTLAELFYSNDQPTLDKRIESSRRAQEALMAITPSGAVVAPIDLINGLTNNPGSLLAIDRTADSNLYMSLVAMASLGALQSRYSNPDTTTWLKQQVLGWTPGNTNGWADATDTLGDGCGFSASLLNMIDSIDQISVDPGGSGGAAFAQMISGLKPIMGDICNAGCRGTPNAVIDGQTIDFSGTGCTFTDNQCAGNGALSCLPEMRNRSSCTGVVANRASCAAAGIAQFVNTHLLWGWTP